MKKLPSLATLLLIAGVVASLGFTHAISSANGPVLDYSAGQSITIQTASGPHTYLLRQSTLMWGWSATGFIASTGGSTTNNGSTGTGSSSSRATGSSSSGSTSATASPAATSSPAATETPMATATKTGGTSGSSGTGTPSGSGSSSSGVANTGSAGSVNGLATGARATVYAECFPGTTFRHMNSSSFTGNNEQNNVCIALAVIVRAPASGTIAATGGNNAAGTGTASATTGSTTETPAAVTTETPAVTMTPTP